MKDEAPGDDAVSRGLQQLRGKLAEHSGEDDRKQQMFRDLLQELKKKRAEERAHFEAGVDAIRNVIEISRRILEILREFEAARWLRELAAKQGDSDATELASESALRVEISRRLQDFGDLVDLVGRTVTRERALRNRARRQEVKNGVLEFERTAHPVFDESGSAGSDPAVQGATQHHDVLIVPPRGVLGPHEYYRVPVNKTPWQTEVAGSYSHKPEVMDMYDFSQRRVFAAARPQEWGPAASRGIERGPAFVTLPVKAEPAATSSCVSYLINTQNLNYRNCWTAEEWNDVPGGEDLPAAPGASADNFEALLAGPQGKVFHVKLRNLRAWQLDTTIPLTLGANGSALNGGSVTAVAMRRQPEAWNQLRNGTVMGRVTFNDAGAERIVPLVNITSLTPT